MIPIMKDVDGKGDRSHKVIIKVTTSSSSSASSDDDDSSSEDDSSSSTESSSSDDPPTLGGGDATKKTTDSEAVEARPTRTPLTGVTGSSNTVVIRKRKTKRRPVTICLSNCRYEIVRHIGRRNGLLEVEENEGWNIYWTDFSVSLERAMDMRRFQIVNHFPGMNEICRKDLLCRNLNRMRRQFPKDFDIYPKTWSLPTDLGELQTYAHTRKSKTYICKPEMGCQGRGIFLIRNIKDLNPFGKIICQMYISKPFLIDSFKFDLRIYVLITSVDPLRVYVYKEGLARFATAKYKPPTNSNTENSYMHLTNYAVNKYSRDYIVDEEGGSKRKLTSVYKWLEERNHDVPALIESIDDVMLKTIISAHPILKHNYRTCFPNHDICSACFEILGFDILLDYKLKPYVLEVNHSPSFHTDTKLDLEIKEGLLHDTFAMLNTKRLDKQKVENADRKRIQDRLLKKNTQVKGRTEKGEWTLEAQFAHEMENCGGFRLIYPKAGSEKFDPYMDQNFCTLYQETAASQARANCTRTQLEEYNQRKMEEERKRAGFKDPIVEPPKDSKGVRPESPAEKDDCKLETQENGGTFAPTQIINDEEIARAKGLMQRGMLIRSLGIELQAFKLLCQLGTLKPEEEKIFRRMHGINYSQVQNTNSVEDVNEVTQGGQADTCPSPVSESEEFGGTECAQWRRNLANSCRDESQDNNNNSKNFITSRKFSFYSMGQQQGNTTTANNMRQNYLDSQMKSELGESGAPSPTTTFPNHHVFSNQAGAARRYYDQVNDKRRSGGVGMQQGGIPGFTMQAAISHPGFNQLNINKGQVHPPNTPISPNSSSYNNLVDVSPRWSIGHNAQSAQLRQLIGSQSARLLHANQLTRQNSTSLQGIKGYLASRQESMNKGANSTYQFGGPTQVVRKNFGFGPHVHHIPRPKAPHDNPLMLTGIRIGPRLNQ